MDSEFETESFYLPESVSSLLESLRGRIHSLTIAEIRQYLTICDCLAMAPDTPSPAATNSLLRLTSMLQDRLSNLL